VYQVVEGEQVEGRPVYKKDGSDSWLMYWAETGVWHLNTATALKGTDSALMHSLGTQKETMSLPMAMPSRQQQPHLDWWQTHMSTRA
jgi:hypothetical protein